MESDRTRPTLWLLLKISKGIGIAYPTSWLRKDAERIQSENFNAIVGTD